MATAMTALEELDRGWSWVVLVSTFGYFMVFGLFLYGVGVVHLALIEEYHSKSATTAWVGGIFAALISLCGPLSSILIDKFSCRCAMFLDGILSTIGCVTTALCPNIYLCILTYGIIAGLGGGIGYTASVVVIGFNFQKFRPVAMTAALSGIGVGTLILSPSMELVRDFYGNAGYFIIIGGIALQKCVFAVLCKPSRIEIERQKALKVESKEALSCKAIVRHYAKVYANKAIMFFSLSLLLYSMGTYMIFLHLPTYSVQTGHSPMSAAWLLSCCGICTVLSRILTDVATNKKLDEIVLYSGSFGTLALGTFLFPLYSKAYAGQLVYSILLGAYFGGCYAIINSINVKIVGTRYQSLATGFELGFSGVGTILGSVITGVILDKGGAYEQCFMVAAFCILVASGLGMATVLFQPDTDQSETPNLDLLIGDNGNLTIETNFAQICKEDSPGETNTKTEETLLSNSSTHQRVCLKNPKDSPIIEREMVPEPINFTEEIQKLLKGESLQFIDES